MAAVRLGARGARALVLRDDDGAGGRALRGSPAARARPANGIDRGLLAILIVACYPAAITAGNGQITFHVVLAAPAGVLIQRRELPGARRHRGLDRAPRDGRRESPSPPVRLVEQGGYGAAYTGYGNLQSWLGAMGLRSWIFPASALAFVLHGLWARRHREAALWTLIGVAAIVARIWAYHRVYDDLLLVLPLIALYRLARPEPSRGWAGALLLLGGIALAAPITPVLDHAEGLLVGIWLAQLVYLGHSAARPGPAAARSGRPIGA